MLPRRFVRSRGFNGAWRCYLHSHPETEVEAGRWANIVTKAGFGLGGPSGPSPPPPCCVDARKFPPPAGRSKPFPPHFVDGQPGQIDGAFHPIIGVFHNLKCTFLPNAYTRS